MSLPAISRLRWLFRSRARASTEARAGWFTRRLRRRYISALIAVALMTIATAVMVQETLRAQENETVAIKLAGELGALSRAIGREALAIQVSVHPTELRHHLDRLASLSADFERQNEELVRVSAGRAAGAFSPVHAWTSRVSGDVQPLLRGQTPGRRSRVRLIFHARRLAEIQRGYRADLDRALRITESSAAQRIRRLRLAESLAALATVALLIAIGWYVIRPVLERLRESFQSLERSEEQKRAILESSPDAIITFDRQGQILDANPAAKEMLDDKRDEIMGKLWASALGPEASGGSSASPESLWLNRRFELTSTSAGGSTQAIEVVVRRIGGEGEPIFTAFLKDITSRKKYEQDIAHSVEEISRSNEELERFAYVASHDLQEPLRMVSSYVNLISQRYKGKLDQSAEEFMAFAIDGAARMRRLIQDLLEYSRVSHRPSEIREVDSAQVVTEVMKDLRVTVQETGATIECGGMPRVKANPTQLKQLFQNLIGNALKYRGPRPPVIRVRARDAGEDWEFEVQDNGIGFDMTDSQRIFEAFQRLHERSEFPGTGIGLAICTRIVQAHGGRMWCHAQTDRGATFFFTLAKELSGSDERRGIAAGGGAAGRRLSLAKEHGDTLA